MSKALSAAALVLSIAGATQAAEPSEDARRAREVTEHIQKNFFDPQSGVYFKSMTVRKPDYVWLQSVMFSNLVAAARSEPATYGPLLQKYFTALDAYWDRKVKIPGYEAAPTRGNGNDKYYDDNEWLVITFLEAYETNRDPRYLTRADETLKFALSGWDEESGGGIWWHQGHKDGTKNACSNGPAAVGCLRLAKFREGDVATLVDQARKIVKWTASALQAEDGLFDDRKVVASGEVSGGNRTYNSALMVPHCWACIGPRARTRILSKPSGSRKPRTGFWTGERASIATRCGTHISWSRPTWNCTAPRRRSTC